MESNTVASAASTSDQLKRLQPRSRTGTVVGAAEATEGKAEEDDEAGAVNKETTTRHLQQCIMGCTIINIEMIVYPN